MRLSLVALAISIAITACQSQPPPDLRVTEQHTVLQFGSMITKLGFGITDYLTYGCYCGIDNAGDDKQPIDATDSCCKTHDTCYVQAPPGCSCYTATYQWYDEAGWIGCIPTGDACADYCCACDQEATNCFASARETWNPSCTNFDRSTCRADGTPQCCGDADCDLGEVCFQGSCYPLCGGGGDPQPLPTAGDGSATPAVAEPEPCVTP